MFSFLKRKKLQDTQLADRRDYVIQTVGFLLERAGGAVLEDAQVTNAGQAVIVLKTSTVEQAEALSPQKEAIETEVGKLTAINKVTVVVTTEQTPPKQQAAKQSPKTEGKVPPVDHIIAVSSGKGGVGKSTVAVNLALAIAATGKKVGLLDADIYGPSIPRLLGVKNSKIAQNENKLIEPIEAHGLKLMSMGFMVDEESPMVWRGPMVQSALLQMVQNVNWGGVDVLVIDMPPGTGDIHLTLAQRIPLSGGVVVSTPQDIALIDARKGLEMFRKVAVPVLGIVENMSYYVCPNCGNREDIFGHGGAREQADQLGVPFLGEIPLHAKIRELSDAGTPVTVADPDSPQAKSFNPIAEAVLGGLETASRPAPRISMED